MLFLICLSSTLLIQFTSAQILSLGMPNGQISNIQRTVNIPSNNVVVANNAISGINSLPFNSVPVSNVQAARTGGLPVSGIVANGNLAPNLVATNVGNTISVPSFGNNFAGSVASANLNNFGANYVGKNIGANVVTGNVPINLSNGFNLNTGTFALNNNGIASLLPANRPCGIQIVADALDVGGAVGVNGQLPFYTTVNVNGKLPSSGSGIVNCACGGQ